MKNPPPRKKAKQVYFVASDNVFKLTGSEYRIWKFFLSFQKERKAPPSREEVCNGTAFDRSWVKDLTVECVKKNALVEVVHGGARSTYARTHDGSCPYCHCKKDS